MIASILATSMSIFFACIAGLGLFATLSSFYRKPAQETAFSFVLIAVLGTIAWGFAYLGGV